VDDEIDSAAALALANAVFDWVDADDDQRYPGGAETVDYARSADFTAGAPQAYRPANQPFASISELRLVKGFSSELVAALTPHVSVWGNGNLNLNTMDAHLDSGAGFITGFGTDFDNAATTATPIMLRTLNTSDSLLPLSIDGARLLAAARSNSGGVVQNFDFFAAAPFNAQDWELDGVALTSAFFELSAVMQTPRRAYMLTSVLRRGTSRAGEPEITVVSRRYGGLETERSCVAAVR
jgi:general secretion pathway protein K